ncbi:MAG TPA: transglycosylase SLT domain-containing protein [Burkholderiaceae bacterium]|nr:transglycosylase SLT domain-containing protein [Burkholderiaceae bacterium]
MNSTLKRIVPTALFVTTPRSPWPAARRRAMGWAVVAIGALASGCAVAPPAPETAPSGEASVAAPVFAAPSAPPAPEPAPAPPPVETTVAPPSAPNTAPSAPPEAADPLQPEKRVDFDDPSARTDLWSRLRAGYSLPTMSNARVRKWEQYYTERPDYVARMTERGGRYLFFVVEELEKRNMPLDLALLPFVESAFNPQAMSVARAAGMWQFMPSTGRIYALKQNAFRDDRRDVLASTRAALDYLERLGAMFNGDWQLALAAYNWGEGNVQRALQRKRDRNAPSVYESLRGLPVETRDYVPKLQAVKNIVAKPEAFGLTLQPLENHPYFLSVAIERDIDVELAAKLAGIGLEEFQQLNPQMNRPVILAAGTPQVLLPYDAANAFVRNLPRHEGPLATWTVWVAPRTLKPAEAAELVGMSEVELRDVNRIPPSMLVQAGSSLVVPRPEATLVDVPEHLAENGHLALAPDTRGFRRVTFRAPRRGDSVAAVARRYHVPAEHVAMWNHVGVEARFRGGQNIVVMVPAKPAASRKVAASAGKQANLAAKR